MAQQDENVGGDAGEVGYQSIAGDVWEQQALDYYRSRQLQLQAFSTDGVVSVQIWGTCPRCRHNMDVQQTLTAPVVTYRGGWKGVASKGPADVPASIAVGCGCGLTHNGAPKDTTGCGLSFRLPTTPPAP